MKRDVIKQGQQSGYQSGCLVAESVAQRVITLPNHAALLRACRESHARIAPVPAR